MGTELHLLSQSRKFVTHGLAELPSTVTFHTIEHTRKVVKAARIIGKASQLTAEQLDTVLIAAWFHDIGYCNGASGHEERSASIAAKMLTAWGAVRNKVTDVERTILATRLPQQPQDMMGMVLCDADLSHLGSSQYQVHASKLRIELQAMRGLRLENDQAWCQLNIQFLKNHHYFTDYGKIILESRKKVNLNRMKRQLHTQPLC